MYDVNLYPPIFNQSIMPAFVITGAARIYFSVSPLNNIDDVKKRPVQLTIRSQKTNENMLKNDYINEIKLLPFQTDLTREGNDKYFVEISHEYIKNNVFNLNEYYKIQLRFTDSRAQSPPSDDTPAFSDWLVNNTQNFSQWSTVALIRGISQPTETITVNGSSDTVLYLNTNYIEINGNVSFQNVADTEKLEKYRVKLYKGAQLIQDSGDIISENNLINYIIKTVLSENSIYILVMDFITNNSYKFSLLRNRSIRISTITPMPANIILNEIVRNDIGCINIVLKRNLDFLTGGEKFFKPYYSFIVQTSDDDDDVLTFIAHQEVTELSGSESNRVVSFDQDTVEFDSFHSRMLFLNEYMGNFLSINDRIIIRRSDSLSNFSKWAKLADFTIEENDLTELHWYDYTAEPGVWYRYEVIRQNALNEKTAELITPENTPVMLDTEDIFLNAQGEELIIRFDPIINNLTNKVAESITDTIGSKYPFFRRNGIVDYKTFSLSGTITSFMNVNGNVLHGSKENLYGDSAHFYKEYNNKKNIGIYNDFIYEKFFRQKVIKFLQSTDIKLMRSMTEGNILIRLNNITLTPNPTLGRMIYSFSCNAYEVAECNENNYLKFNILGDNIKTFKRGQ